MSAPDPGDIRAMDYDEKCKALEGVISEFMERQMEFAEVSAQYARLRAHITVLREIKSALQSAIRAEQAL